MTTVFLTGASGFLGGHLLRELRTAGCAVRAMSRRAEADAIIAKAGGDPVRSDLRDATSLQVALAGCEAVFRAAADTSMWRPQATAQTATNVLGTENLLRAAELAGVQAFVHTSSVSAYSHLAHGTLVESTPQRGAESWINYERTKYLGEQAVRRAGVPWIIFNPSHILGPGDRHNWARVIVLVDREKLPGIPPGSGSFADVREIARAQVSAWQRKRFGEAYLVGGEHASFVDFVQRLGAALGKRTPSRATPAWAPMTFARVADAWSRVSGREPDVTPERATLVCQPVTRFAWIRRRPGMSSNMAKRLSTRSLTIPWPGCGRRGWSGAEGLVSGGSRLYRMTVRRPIAATLNDALDQPADRMGQQSATKRHSRRS